VNVSRTSKQAKMLAFSADMYAAVRLVCEGVGVDIKLSLTGFSSCGAEVAKSRHDGLSAKVDYSQPLGGECCIDYTACRQKSPRRYILNLLLTVEIKSSLGRKEKKICGIKRGLVCFCSRR